METLKTQIDGVNAAANSLVENGHPRSGEVVQCQEGLNSRLGVGRAGGIISGHPAQPWDVAPKLAHVPCPARLYPQNTCLSQPVSL